MVARTGKLQLQGKGKHEHEGEGTDRERTREMQWCADAFGRDERLALALASSNG